MKIRFIEPVDDISSSFYNIFWNPRCDDAIAVISLETRQILGELQEDRDGYYFELGNQNRLGNMPQFAEYRDTSLENVKKQIVALFAEI